MKQPVVVLGASATALGRMVVWILESAGLEPAFSIAGEERASTRRKIVGDRARAPFVTDRSTEERPHVLVLTSGATGAALPEATVVVASARSRVAGATHYGLEDDAEWMAALVPGDGVQPFDLYAGGSYCGRFAMKALGEDNVRSAVGAIAVCAEGFGVGIEVARKALVSFTP